MKILVKYNIYQQLIEKNNKKAYVELKVAEDGISPGQACVFYNQDNFGFKVLGGGWIID